MTSALACVGLSVRDEAELNSLVTSAWRTVRETGVFGGVHVGRWQDDSGAVLILGWRSGELVASSRPMPRRSVGCSPTAA